MTTTKAETVRDAQEYLRSLRPPEPQFLASADGARLFSVGDEHMLVIACAEHDDHTGHRALVTAKVPAGWVCFAQFYNLDDELDYFHYGPERTSGQLADAPEPVAA